jgi:hypothetical protein
MLIFCFWTLPPWLGFTPLVSNWQIKIILTTVKNKVNYPKAYFTIEYHLCHIDDQSILAAIVPTLPVSSNKLTILWTLNFVKPKHIWIVLHEKTNCVIEVLTILSIGKNCFNNIEISAIVVYF